MVKHTFFFLIPTFHSINWVFDEINIDFYNELISCDAEQFMSKVLGAVNETQTADAHLNTLASRGFLCIK